MTRPTDTPLDLEALRALAEKARQLVSEIAKHGDKKFRMCVPPQDDDADMLLTSVCDGLTQLCDELQLARNAAGYVHELEKAFAREIEQLRTALADKERHAAELEAAAQFLIDEAWKVCQEEIRSSGMGFLLLERAIDGMREFVSTEHDDEFEDEDAASPPSPTAQESSKETTPDFAESVMGTMERNPNGCGCWKCNPRAAWFVVCDKCGCKRCPHATDHELTCTGSNKSGQKGSLWENAQSPCPQPKESEN